MRGLTEGAPCDTPEPCSTGLACNYATEPPRCEPAGTPGSTCTSDIECATDLTCNPYWHPAQCRGPGEVGEPCYGKLPAICKQGLVCNWLLDGPAEGGQCALPGAAGDGCWQNSDCLPGLTCKAQLCAA
jgi:hypothetical protein